MLIRQFFLTQNCLEVVLYLRGTGVDRFWPRPPAPPPAGARSETARQFLRRTFKFNSNEEEKKATKREKKETYRMKITLPLFLPKNVFPIKISVFRLFVSFCVCVCFIRMQLYVFFTLILFFRWFVFPCTPLPHRLNPPPTPPNPPDPHEVTCTKRTKIKTGERQ